MKISIDSIGFDDKDNIELNLSDCTDLHLKPSLVLAAKDLLDAAIEVSEWAREQKISIPVRCGLDTAINKAKNK